MSPSKPKPPVKPSANATRKALLAYHSELKKYHEKLEEWEQKLWAYQARLKEDRMTFDEQYAEFEEMVEAEGFEWEYECDAEEIGKCECGKEDAINGCECKACSCWRSTKDQEEKARKPAIGDEVEFLEKLFKLKDKRRIKKPAHSGIKTEGHTRGCQCDECC